MKGDRTTVLPLYACMDIETSVEANLLSEYVNQNAITVPLPDGDEDFTKKKRK